MSDVACINLDRLRLWCPGCGCWHDPFHGPDNCENVDCNATAIYIDTLSDLYLCIRHADERAFAILTVNAR